VKHDWQNRDQCGLDRAVPATVLAIVERLAYPPVMLDIEPGPGTTEVYVEPELIGPPAGGPE
jgi:hypothetical protein